MVLTGEPDPMGEPSPEDAAAGESFWAKWATVVIVGVVCLFVLSLAVGAMLRVDHPGPYLAAVGIATFIGGRLGGVRGVGQWLSAAISIVLVSVAITYLLVLAVISQITGP